MGGKKRMGEGRNKAKESRVVPYPKLNPGCATGTAVDLLFVSETLHRISRFVFV